MGVVGGNGSFQFLLIFLLYSLGSGGIWALLSLKSR